MLMTAAEEVLQLGVTEMEQPRMPFERAVLELACGRALRRAGQRRISAGQLQVARDLTAPLDPHPYLERRDGGLAAGGQSATVRSDFDCRRLTAQESAVAKLVGAGMDDRHVARELFIGIPTVKFHLTHIYTKLGINSRLELGALLEQARG
jgi:DNA-binding NarL/FixJ family response regulator